MTAPPLNASKVGDVLVQVAGKDSRRCEFQMVAAVPLP